LVGRPTTSVTECLNIVYASAIFVLLSASYALAQQLHITETQTMGFGTLTKPTSGSHYMILNSNGSALSGTGTRIGGTYQIGRYNIRRTGGGNGNISISLAIMSIVTGSPALTLGNFEGIYDGITSISSFPRGGLPIPRNINKELRLGCRATYTSAVPVGPMNNTFDIVAIVE
jgi:hypothetical protein